jgi:hypothetical protein
VSSTNKADRHAITEILLTVALNTTTLTQKDNRLLPYVFGCHISYVTVANYGYPIYVIVPNMHCTLKSIGLTIFLLWNMIWGMVFNVTV